MVKNNFATFVPFPCILGVEIANALTQVFILLDVVIEYL